MDSQQYAFLDEVWGTSNASSVSPNPACELLKKTKKQSIMDAYIADQENAELKFESRPPQYDINQVEGYNTINPSYAQQYGIDEYFLDELKTSKPASSKNMLPSNIPEEEHVVTPLTREEIYKTIVEKYSSALDGGSTKNVNANVLSEQYYVELFVYLISGVFLIFFMEQILQVGAKIAGRK